MFYGADRAGVTVPSRLSCGVVACAGKAIWLEYAKSSIFSEENTMKRLGLLLLLLGLSLAATAPADALPPPCYEYCPDGWTGTCTCGTVVRTCTTCNQIW
jgi:hypothetical protein